MRGQNTAPSLQERSTAVYSICWARCCMETLWGAAQSMFIPKEFDTCVFAWAGDEGSWWLQLPDYGRGCIRAWKPFSFSHLCFHLCSCYRPGVPDWFQKFVCKIVVQSLPWFFMVAPSGLPLWRGGNCTCFYPCNWLRIQRCWLIVFASWAHSGKLQDHEK